MKTLTAAITENQKPNETMTQCLHRMRDADETMTHEAYDLAKAGTPPPAHVPAPPTGFAKPTSSGITATGAKISWKAPTGGDPVTGYSVSVKKGATAIAGSPFAIAAGTLNKVLTGLTASTAYTVVVTATNADGSKAAPALTVTTVA
jgi:hypothetical protein